MSTGDSTPPDAAWAEIARAVAQGDRDDAFGPIPKPTRVPRWFTLAGPPAGDWPRRTAICRRATGPIRVDGRLNDAAWSTADWSQPFVTIENGAAVPLESRVALLWDDEHLYAGFAFEDPDPRATATEHHSWVFLTDPDAELFVAGPGGAVECGINPLGTVYEVLWTWLEPLIERRDHEAIERLLMVPNGMFITARPGERSGCLGDLDWEFPGARYTAAVGQVPLPGRPAVGGWSAVFALPWSGLAAALGPGMHPEPGLQLSVQAYRAVHDASDATRNAAMAELWGEGATPFAGWTWAPQGNTNVHNPECWVHVTLAA